MAGWTPQIELDFDNKALALLTKPKKQATLTFTLLGLRIGITNFTPIQILIHLEFWW